MAELWTMLRQALRSLRRSPAFSLTVVATLGIGIGLNAAIFTVVDCVLLRPLGYHDADRIVALRTHFHSEARSIARLGGDDYTDVMEQVKGLESTALYNDFPDGIELHGASIYLPVAMVSPRFGEVMGVQPVAGRLFRSSDATGTDALVSESFVREHFASNGDAVGQGILFNGAMRTVVGVLPDGFSFPAKTQVWFEEGARPSWPNRTSYNDKVVGKRRAGVSAEQLDAELTGFSRQLQRAYPEDRDKSIEAVALQEQIVGKIRPTLRLLMGAVGVILLIVCANVTHLQLVRATRQLRAVTIRTALGASRSALAGRALMEAMLLATAGCGTAMVLAVPTLSLLVRLAPPEIPRLADVHLNGDVLLFSFALSVVLMAVTAVLPVWRSWQLDPASAMRQDASRGTETRGLLQLRNVFLMAEVALTLTLSVSAVLLTRQLIAQSKVDLGFSPDRLITLDTHAILPVKAEVTGKLSKAAQAAMEDQRAAARLARFEAILASVAGTPGVESADGILGAPMGFGGSDASYAVKGRQVFLPGAVLPNAEIRPMTPGLPRTLGMPLLRGRELNAEDRRGAPNVVLINEALARQSFAGEDPLGKQIMCGYDDEAGWWTIVGVVGDIREDSPAAVPTPTFYLPIAQHNQSVGDAQFVVRTRGGEDEMVERLRRSLNQSQPDVAVKATTMRVNLGAVQRAERFRTMLFGGFAGVSILLAAVGMYGVTAYTVAQRRYEFGLRMALGADRGQVLGMVLRQGAGVTLAGIGLGVVLCVGLMRVLASVVGRLPAFDPVAYLLASVVVVAIALLATMLPARAAAGVDPMNVLRSE